MFYVNAWFCLELHSFTLFKSITFYKNLSRFERVIVVQTTIITVSFTPITLEKMEMWHLLCMLAHHILTVNMIITPPTILMPSLSSTKVTRSAELTRDTVVALVVIAIASTTVVISSQTTRFKIILVITITIILSLYQNQPELQ